MQTGTKREAMPRLRLLLALLLIALIAGAAALWQNRLIGKAAPPAATPASPLAARIDREANRIIGQRPPYRTLYADARQVRADILRRDFAAADKTLTRRLSQSSIQAWHFNPFATLVEYVAQPGEPIFGKRLDEWVARAPQSPMPYLVRALYGYRTGWMIRGDRFVNDVQPAHLKAFARHIAQALDDVSRSIQLDHTDPYSAFLLLYILSGTGNTTDMAAAFHRSTQQFPDYYPLYRQRLTTLEPKWGGSIEAMRAFVDRHAGTAAPHAPIRMLYLQLYADLLNAASVSCLEEHGDERTRCVESAMVQMDSSDLENRAYAALQLYNYSDKAHFSETLGDILGQMINTRGAERYAGAFLQLAANIMGSDNQLTSGNTRNNNFTMDRLTALVWYRQGQYDNAEKLYRRAIADLAHTHFTTPSERDEIHARLLDDLADIYSHRKQYLQEAAYDKAADLMRGGSGRGGYSDLLCASLFHLKHYREAVDACTARMENSGSLHARYWRGRAYESLRDLSAAERDLAQVAASESDYRSYAAIRISILYGNQGKLESMLKALNTYTYLYDDALSDRDTIAIAYNNRCYAKMHLGQLRAALKDCTASLHYGNLPDAYSKQQTLLKRLRQ
ncbi:tetratricopeptide repeat protein [Acidihalobacter prosperus]|uniref:DUF4034 domain-containing protein n=1 Tax=Acidihalobacter prosperus TaxID=160660 RepID=A0A1A6C2C9_9GAMM|nr:hypothetical protein [Acidihalobacter prosperus]OBS08721.1 hypothetical protein Thpro_022971 [Acidihalobacter prosperus]